MLHRLHRRSSAAGFTLIELLVVITILGILAAIVVFAVKGIGDKGKANAIAADASVLRIAEEANCAKYGEYADVGELKEKKLLASASTYNTVLLGSLDKCGTGDRSSFTIADATSPTKVIKTIDVGGSPRQLAINPVRNRVYVLNTDDGTMTVINGATTPIATIPVGAAPASIDVNPDNAKVYVLSGNVTDGFRVHVIDGMSNTEIVTGGIPWAYPKRNSSDPADAVLLAVNPANEEVYVCGNAATMMAINGSSNTPSDVDISSAADCEATRRRMTSTPSDRPT